MAYFPTDFLPDNHFLTTVPATAGILVPSCICAETAGPGNDRLVAVVLGPEDNAVSCLVLISVGHLLSCLEHPSWLLQGLQMVASVVRMVGIVPHITLHPKSSGKLEQEGFQIGDRCGDKVESE